MSCPKCDHAAVEAQNFDGESADWILDVGADCDPILFCPFCGYELPSALNAVAAERVCVFLLALTRATVADRKQRERRKGWYGP